MGILNLTDFNGADRMLDLVSLRKTGTGWEFASEAALEDFVWLNLPQLFGLTPLKRQYSVDGQFCDILALGESQELVVLELKNVEDRYVVQQLTRYYHALCEKKAFSEQIDYEKPVRLIAVAPSFHRDNLIDRKYHHLSIEFGQFTILAESEKYYLQLKDLENEKVTKLEIPFQEQETKDNIPDPPRAFLNRLAKCTDKEQKQILKIRQKILSFDQRMQETANGGNFKYGKGQNLCAELYFNSNSNEAILFLWLPFLRQRPSRARARIFTNWKTVSHIGYANKGFLKVKIVMQIEHYKIELRYYRKDLATIDNYENLEILVDSCLEEWRKKL